MARGLEVSAFVISMPRKWVWCVALIWVVLRWGRLGSTATDLLRS